MIKLHGNLFNVEEYKKYMCVETVHKNIDFNACQLVSNRMSSKVVAENIILLYAANIILLYAVTSYCALQQFFEYYQFMGFNVVYYESGSHMMLSETHIQLHFSIDCIPAAK